MAIVGPTAAGKSNLAMDVARRTGAEILSVDSMQVYRGMDIGTAKPTSTEQEDVPHHMVDVAEPEESYTVARFRQEARQALSASPAPVVLVVGGSGLHFRSVVDPMEFRPFDPELRDEVGSADPQALVAELEAADPDAARHVDLDNPRRVQRAVETLRLTGLAPSDLAMSEGRRRFVSYEPELPFVGFAVDTGDIDERVEARLRRMRSDGLLEEVAGLEGRLGQTASQAVGYRQLLPVVRGETTADQGFEEAAQATRRLAKRQRTFFRRDPRLTWLDGNETDLADRVMEGAGL